MDDLDVAILREMSRDRVVVWGTTDPRLSAEALAKRVKVDPTTVRDRLRAWQACGFLRGFSVVPNSSLVGAGLASGALRVPDARDKARVLSTLRMTPGMFGTMDHVGEWVGLGFVDESEASLQSLLKTVAAIPGVAEVTPAFRVPTPASTVDLTPLDKRVVAALRAHPREPLSVAAASAGVSTRTFARRYERLVAGKALWSSATYDFGKFDGRIVAQVIVTLATDADARAAINALHAAHDCWTAWHVVPPGLSGGDHAIADLYFAPRSMGELERILHDARGLAGARDVECYHPLQYDVWGDWIDAKLP